MVKIYYFISACLLLFTCNNNNKEGNVNDTINDTIVERLNNPLAGKKFYYLEKDKTGTLILKNILSLKVILRCRKLYLQIQCSLMVGMLWNLVNGMFQK